MKKLLCLLFGHDYVFIKTPLSCGLCEQKHFCCRRCQIESAAVEVNFICEAHCPMPTRRSA